MLPANYAVQGPCITVGCLSVRLSVWLSRLSTAAATCGWQLVCCWARARAADIDRQLPAPKLRLRVASRWEPRYEAQHRLVHYKDAAKTPNWTIEVQVQDFQLSSRSGEIFQHYRESILNNVLSWFHANQRFSSANISRNSIGLVWNAADDWRELWLRESWNAIFFRDM